MWEFELIVVSLFSQEAAALGLVPTFSYTGGPIVIDTSVMPVFVAEVMNTNYLSLKEPL